MIDFWGKIKAIASLFLETAIAFFLLNKIMVTINSSKKHGVASLESYRGRLRIHLPKAYYAGKNKYLNLFLADNEKNRAIAKDKLNWINGDIVNDRLDITLERYQSQAKQQALLQLVEIPKPVMELKQIWDCYLKYISPTRKPSTLKYLEEVISAKIRVCEIDSPYDAIAIRDWLLTITTPDVTKRVLIQLNAACKWAIKHGKLTAANSPFEGMAQEFKYNYEIESIPNAFTFEERDRILAAFKAHKDGYSYSYYTNFVEFMFLTGCRPCEAISLTWDKIDPNYRYVLLNSKNNCTRKFPCNERLRELLKSIPHTHTLVFPSPKGGSINYNNFSRRAWDTIVNPIKPGTTPYSCRDTFITEQIAKGVSSAILAKWVDNSVKVIEKHYLDMASIDHILPQ
jgi:integrase